MLRGEQAEYAEEGLPWTHVDFKDNQPCLDLIDSRPQLGGAGPDPHANPNPNPPVLAFLTLTLTLPWVP